MAYFRLRCFQDEMSKYVLIALNAIVGILGIIHLGCTFLIYISCWALWLNVKYLLGHALIKSLWGNVQKNFRRANSLFCDYRSLPNRNQCADYSSDFADNRKGKPPVMGPLDHASALVRIRLQFLHRSWLFYECYILQRNLQRIYIRELRFCWEIRLPSTEGHV